MKGKIIPFLEFGNTEAIKQAAAAGLGISCLSKTAVAEALKNGQLLELPTPYLKLSRDFYITYSYNVITLTNVNIELTTDVCTTIGCI